MPLFWVLDDAQLRTQLVLALAYLGRRGEAIREGERAAAQLTLERDGYNGAYYQLQLVRIYLLTGEREKALERLQPLLEIPFYLSPGWLRVDPTFGPLAGHQSSSG